MSIKSLSLGSAAAAAAGIVISGTTNATPVVATFGAGHGLKDGDRVAVAGITGNTGANGEFSLKFTSANAAQLVGSAGNGVHGGTPRVAVLCDKTPVMKGHSATLATFGNLVGTLDIEAYDSYADFAAGTNVSGISAPAASGGALGVTNSNGSGAAPAKSSVVLAATNAGIELELAPLPRYLRAVVSAYTSGTGGAVVHA